jgi:glycosyltransferase involved in cell wall biosynthesis
VDTNKKIGVIYLGKRGAGKAFADLFIRELQRDEVFSFAVVSKYAGFECARPDLFMIRTPHKIFEIYLLPFFLIDILKVIIKMKKNNKFAIILPMASPTDLIASKIISISGCKVFRVIHELVAHKGESWPTRNAIKKRISNSSGLIFLSHAVESQYQEFQITKSFKTLPSIALNHPIMPRHPLTIVPTPSEFKDYALIIGRIQEYKGIDNFLQSWKKRTEFRAGKLIIAGEGKLSKKFMSEIEQQDDILLINRWLSDSEFEYLIANSMVLVLPYLEASQSGIIPIGQRYQIPILLTNVGGLIEQVYSYPYFATYDQSDDPGLKIRLLIEGASKSSTKETGQEKVEAESSREFVSKILEFVNIIAP